MIYAGTQFLECINSPIRQVKGRVELYQGSTLLDVFNANDRLQSFTIERSGEESKFFGYGICQKLTTKLLDKERALDINKTQSLEAVFGTQCDYIYTNPVFYIEDVQRDELSNDLTIVAYDALYKATSHQVSELELKAPYTLEAFAAACVALLGLPLNHAQLPSGFNTTYPLGANLDGTETIRAALDAIAEVTQSIYYIDHNWEVTFKRLNKDGAPVLLIDKSQYFDMQCKEPVTITEIGHVTELGDNVSAGLKTGRTQYVRNNPFWEMRTDIGALVSEAAANISGLTIIPFNCTWRGNYLVEIGDKIAMVTKDNNVIQTYLLHDTITYNGGLQQKTQWVYQENQSETPTNPATLGEALNQTYAKVDKVNQRIDLVATKSDASLQLAAQLSINVNGIQAEVSRVEADLNQKIASIDIDADGIYAEVSRVETELNQKIANIDIGADGINASISRLEQVVDDNNEAVNESIATLTRKVNTSITAEDVQFAIQTEMNNGVDKVITSTGYTFNEEGLTVSKSGSEMTTQITEDGMTVFKDGSTMLKADHTGVKAENLHATTYMIIGTTSRFEDYDGRTGCFWIGG